MRINFMMFWHFLMFLFAAEDSSQWHGAPHMNTARNEVANKVKMPILGFIEHSIFDHVF